MKNKFSAIFSEEKRAFIEENLNTDLNTLVLKLSKKKWDTTAIINQIIGRKISRKKIPSWHKNPEIKYPRKLAMEQCSSELTARYKSQLFKGKKFIVLTGGIGVDSYFISQSFESGIHIEQNKELQAIVSLNFETLKTNINSYCTNGIEFLKNNNQKFDLIYLDPSRRDINKNRVYQIEDYTPNITEHIDLLFSKSNNILIKTSPFLDFSKVTSKLPNVKAIYVLSVKNDCKEVLYHLQKKFTKYISYHCCDLSTKSSFNFSEDQEYNPCQKSLPLRYIYEPNNSILKAGGFNTIGNAFELKKLHNNSHLFTSHKFISNFPGRIFKLKETLALNIKKVKKKIPSMKANITKRNFPISVKEIRKKTGLKEGGEVYIFATTLMNDKPQLLICEKLK